MNDTPPGRRCIYNTLRPNYVHFCDLGLVTGFLEKASQKPWVRSSFIKSTSRKRKIDKSDFLKIRTLVIQKILLKK